MDKQDFKFIKGSCTSNTPADIYFYTDVEYWSVERFLYEFDYLVNSVCPSKIRVHINSVGGSVVEGMSVFSKLIDCKIKIECINDALAASIGSIIWAAGDELYMKDFALLMIHNPFLDKGENKEYNQITDAFAKQLKTIYMKRFNLSEAEVENIMNGEEGNDGTFLTADEAVSKGFVKAENVLETPSAIKDKIKEVVSNTKDVKQLKAVFNLIDSSMIQNTILETNIKPNKKTMENNEINVFAALLGLTGEKATTENVNAAINDLKSKATKFETMEKSLQETKSQLTKVEAELAGAQTSVKNLTEDLNKTKDALKVYQEAEAEAMTKKVNDLIDKAVNDCKISKEERDTYLKMAQNDYDLAVNVLNKIPARDNLGNIISQSNKGNAEKGMKSEEEAVNAMVDEVVGKDFKFRTLEGI